MDKRDRSEVIMVRVSAQDKKAFEEAAEKLDKLAADLQKMQQQLEQAENLQEILDQLADAKDAMNSAGVGSLFNALNFGQMYGLHVMLFPIGITILVVLHIVQVRMRGVVKPIEPGGRQ